MDISELVSGIFSAPQTPRPRQPGQAGTRSSALPMTLPEPEVDTVGTFLKGMGSGGGALLPAIGGGMAAVEEAKRARNQTNETYQLLIKKGLDPETAKLAVTNPNVGKAVIEKMFGKNDAPKYGMNGQILQGPDGKYYSMQFSESGKTLIQPIDQGLSPFRGTGLAGDEIYNKATGEGVRNIAPQLAGAEKAKEIGTAQGKAAGAAASDIASAETALELIDSIKTDKNREMGTGKSAIFNAVPWTGGFDFQKKVDQAKAGAFLSAIQQLRGMGALSNAEGQTATAAVTRLTTMATEEGFASALADYEAFIRKGLERARAIQAGTMQPFSDQEPMGTGQAQQPGQFSIRKLD